MTAKVIHLYAGPADGAHVQAKLAEGQTSVRYLDATYVFNQLWSDHFKRLTFIHSGYAGFPGKEAAPAA